MGKRFDLLFCAGVKSVARPEGVRRGVGPSRSLHYACFLVCVCVWRCRLSTVGGGFFNTASAYNSFVGGGGARTSDSLGGNVASGSWSAVLGGSFNTAKGM